MQRHGEPFTHQQKMNNEQIKTVRQAAHTLVNCADDFGLMKRSVDDLYRVFSSITGVTIDQLNSDKDVMLPSGKAISTAAAAHCLLEMTRTAVFLRGINQAISVKIPEAGGKPIRILYAGTGPYATLVAPLLALFMPSEIKVDLLDINPVSLSSAVKILEQLGLEQFIGAVYLADAAIFKVEENYDVVISETMQAALKKEPQVAIMQNLIAQTGDRCIFIPEAITVEAALVSSGKLNAETCSYEGVRRISLGKILTVDRNHLDVENDPQVVQVPNAIGECRQMNLYTTIRVFGEHVLGEGDCSLTLPLRIGRRERVEGEVFTFWYEQAEVPGIRYLLDGTETVFEAFTRSVHERNMHRIEKLLT